MPVKLNAQEFREKHARRLKAAVPDIQRGVENVTEAPGAKAAAQSEKWIQNLTKQSTVEKWVRQVGGVPLEDWKKAMLQKGVGRIAAGIDNASAKVEDFAEKLITHQNNGLRDIEAMPDLTLEDSVQRASTWIRHMANFRR